LVTHDVFVRHIRENPDDAGLRLIYADWLEERNDPRAAFLRVEVELAALPQDDERRPALQARLREMAPTIDPDWLAALDRTRVENCHHFDSESRDETRDDVVELTFEFKCPRRWEELRTTEKSTVRFCETCQQNVYYCPTVSEAWLHAMNRHCVAVNSRQERTPGDVAPPVAVMGMIEPRTGDQLEIGDQVCFRAAEWPLRLGIIEAIDSSRRKATVRILVDDRTKLVEANLDDLFDV
jgi:uncharacterized protein (TIGR02996 family)